MPPRGIAISPAPSRGAQHTNPQLELFSLIEYLNKMIDMVLESKIESLISISHSQKLNDQQMLLRNFQYGDLDYSNTFIK